MTLRAKIYQPSKNAMQSGLSKTGMWRLEYEAESARQPEPLMGWTSSKDTLNQVRVTFHTLEEAVDFANKKGFIYTVLPPQERKVTPRNYGDNFKYFPPEENTGKS